MQLRSRQIPRDQLCRSEGTRRLQPRQIYCHCRSEFEFYLIVNSNCCQHVFKLAASKYEFPDSCTRVFRQKETRLQDSRNSYFDAANLNTYRQQFEFTIK